MYFNLMDLLRKTGMVGESRFINKSGDKENRVKITAVRWAEGEGQEKPIQKDAVYVLPLSGQFIMESLDLYEKAGCTGVVLIGDKLGSYREYKGRMAVAEAVSAMSPVEIAQALCDVVIQECQDSYREIVDTNRYLSNNTLNRHNIVEMLEYFKGLMKNPVAVFDRMFHCLAATDEFLKDLICLRTLPNKVSLDSKYLTRYFVRQRVSLHVEGTQREYTMISFPISFQGKVKAFLSIPQIYQKVEGLDYPKMEITASAIMAELKHEFALQMAEERNIDSFFYNLIHRKNPDLEELKEQARLFGFKNDRPFITIIFCVECQGEILDAPLSLSSMLRPSKEEKMFLTVKKCVEDMGEPVLTGYVNGKIMALLETDSMEAQGVLHIKECCKKVKKAFKVQFTKSKVQIGVGSGEKDLRKICKSYENAKRAVSYGRLLYGEETDYIVEYKDTVLLKLIGSMGDQEELKNLVPPGLYFIQEYDKAHNSRLLDTITVYFEYNCNLRQSADVMNIHYKTMAYRMNQIYEICKTDFSESDTKLHYALGIKILGLLRDVDKEK